MNRVPKQPKPSVITAHVRALADAELTILIAQLEYSTKVGQSALAKARQEQKRRKRIAREAVQA